MCVCLPRKQWAHSEGCLDMKAGKQGDGCGFGGCSSISISISSLHVLHMHGRLSLCSSFWLLQFCFRTKRPWRPGIRQGQERVTCCMHRLYGDCPYHTVKYTLNNAGSFCTSSRGLDEPLFQHLTFTFVNHSFSSEVCARATDVQQHALLPGCNAPPHTLRATVNALHACRVLAVFVCTYACMCVGLNLCPRTFHSRAL